MNLAPVSLGSARCIVFPSVIQFQPENTWQGGVAIMTKPGPEANFISEIFIRLVWVASGKCSFICQVADLRAVLYLMSATRAQDYHPHSSFTPPTPFSLTDNPPFMSPPPHKKDLVKLATNPQIMRTRGSGRGCSKAALVETCKVYCEDLATSVPCWFSLNLAK